MIRKYTNSDKESVLTLLRLNTPHFFASSEEKDFIDYLDTDSENYFVVENKTEIIGCGGFNNGFDNGATSRIAWDIIHPNQQGKGVGKMLTQYRINEIRKQPKVRLIIVRTTQLTFRFYEKVGFKLVKTVKDFWEKGFDLYQMELKIE